MLAALLQCLAGVILISTFPSARMCFLFFFSFKMALSWITKHGYIESKGGAAETLWFCQLLFFFHWQSVSLSESFLPFKVETGDKNLCVGILKTTCCRFRLCLFSIRVVYFWTSNETIIKELLLHDLELFGRHIKSAINVFSEENKSNAFNSSYVFGRTCAEYNNFSLNNLFHGKINFSQVKVCEQSGVLLKLLLQLWHFATWRNRKWCKKH